ncbi:hypothetical protein VOLCADRAFT_98958 [Volvox carteri f. nagariensis]|uniref:Uncharacterized protein n=1 Tax=Volvox carteri f. nagariensis TaxID=3068 RepID=D8UGQ2_VOLCA|nr:uncharacterized protein VOLCADRAFT_98958 [Volvox carteri f. nagariensis]EFJ41087.1 hypothetical protein VOLCADRAFT_98958 [Volvox carteri f. nagariensis]|eukprot:XP_002957850.1 hypothetical protein VOLCADRAFT_98958 [Volvox carteri f. nagariensis]
MYERAPLPPRPPRPPPPNPPGVKMAITKYTAGVAMVNLIVDGTLSSRIPSCTTLPPEGTLLYHPATGGYTDSILARQERSRESPAARTLNSTLPQSQSSTQLQQPGMVLGSGLQQVCGHARLHASFLYRGQG